MRLAYIVENYGQISESFVTFLIDGLVQAGLNLHVFEDRKLASRHQPPSGFAVQETGFTTNLRKSVHWVALAAKVALKKDIRLHLRSSLGRKALLKPLQKFSPDIAYIDHGNNAVFAREALNHLRIPFVAHFHGRDATQLLGNADYLWHIRLVFQDAAAIIVGSHHIKRRLILAGCPERKIVHIPYGVKIEEFPKPDWEERRELGPSLIHLGRMVEKKSPLALVHAFKIVSEKIPEATLTMIGDGPQKSILAGRIKELGLEKRVRLLSSLPYKQAMDEIRNHRVYVQHCVTDSKGDQEGFNISLLEAATHGLPVVSTLHDGIPDHVIDGETGFLVREYDYETMAERIIQLFEDPLLAEKMGQAGRKSAEENFRFQLRTERILSLLKAVAGMV